METPNDSNPDLVPFSPRAGVEGSGSALAGSGPQHGAGPRPSERDLIQAALRHQTPFELIPGVDEPLPPPETFPGYDLIREIHRGGQGVVYLAGQRTTKRRVAIKVMHNGPFAGSKGRARFEREVQVLGQLNHPNIVRIHDSGVTKDGSFFYVMDYISGRPLNEFVQNKKMTVDETLRLFSKICAGINAAHLKGVIHRDIKPANIRVDQNGEPIIVDFGLAKIAVPDMLEEGKPTPDIMSITGQFIGSLPWASPEQAEGAPSNIDVRTDVYSLGVVLYQLLTGKFPYTVIGSMRDVLDHILRTEPAKPSTVRRQIGDEVETIVLKCLRKQRERRYQSAGELGRDIERFLSGQPVDAKSDSGWYVITKTLNRYRLAAGVAAGFVFLVAVAAVVLALMYRQKAAAETRALEATALAIESRDDEKTQRERAEANLATAAALSRTLLVDFPDQIDNLRGATRARELLLTHALSAVERLARDAGDNTEMRALLAESHMRVGDLRAGLYLPSTGTLDAAEASYAAAERIREELASKFPEDAELAAAAGRTAYALAGVSIDRLDFDGAALRADRALECATKAQRLAERAGRGNPFAADGFRARIRRSDSAYRKAERTRDPMASEAALGPAMDAYGAIGVDVRAALEADPASVELARLAGILPDKLSRIWVLRGQRSRNEFEATGDAGRATTAMERFARAETLALESVATFERLSGANPANGILRRDLWVSWHNVATARMESGLTMAALKDGEAAAAVQRRALDAIERAVAIARALTTSDESNLEAQRDLALNLNKLGNIWRELSDAAEGDARAMALETSMGVFTESLAVRRQVLLTDPTQQHRRDVGLGAYKLAQLALKAAQVRQAVGLAEEAMRNFEGLRKDGAIGADSAEIRETGALLQEAQRALANGPPERP